MTAFLSLAVLLMQFVSPSSVFAQIDDSFQMPLSPDEAQQLTTLDVAMAKRLVFARHPAFEGPGLHRLEFKKLSALDPQVAEALATNHGSLFFDAVTELSPEVARAFAAHKELLHFANVSTLTEETAEALARHEGPVSLPALRELESVSLAEKLQLPSNCLYTTLSPRVAQALVKKPFGFLSLPNLKSVSPEVAEQLAKYEGGLLLDGVEKISQAAAARLGSHVGHMLSLSSLADVDPVTADCLSRHAGDLVLGVKSLDVESAQALAGHSGFRLILSELTQMTVPVAQALSLHKGGVRRGAMLCLTNLKSLTRQEAQALTRHEGRLWLTGIQELPGDVAEQLAASRSVALRLRCLRGLKADVARKLAECKCILEFDGDGQGDCTISEEVAAAFADHQGELALFGLTKLDAAVARQLAKHKGPLSLDGMRELSPGVAEALASHANVLALCCLRSELSLQQAKALLRHQGAVKLSPDCIPLEKEVREVLDGKPNIHVNKKSVSDYLFFKNSGAFSLD